MNNDTPSYTFMVFVLRRFRESIYNFQIFWRFFFEKYLSQNFPIQKNIRNLAAQNVKHVGIWQKW